MVLHTSPLSLRVLTISFKYITLSPYKASYTFTTATSMFSSHALSHISMILVDARSCIYIVIANTSFAQSRLLQGLTVSLVNTRHPLRMRFNCFYMGCIFTYPWVIQFVLTFHKYQPNCCSLHLMINNRDIDEYEMSQ